MSKKLSDTIVVVHNAEKDRYYFYADLDKVYIENGPEFYLTTKEIEELHNYVQKIQQEKEIKPYF